MAKTYSYTTWNPHKRIFLNNCHFQEWFPSKNYLCCSDVPWIGFSPCLDRQADASQGSSRWSFVLLLMTGQTTPPPNVPPPIEIEIRVYGSIQAYWMKLMAKKSLIWPYFWGFTLGGLGWLATLVAASDMNNKTMIDMIDMIVIVKPTRGDPKSMLHFHLPAYGDLLKRFNTELKALMKFNIKVDLSRQPTFPPKLCFIKNCHWKFRTNKGSSIDCFFKENQCYLPLGEGQQAWWLEYLIPT